MVECLYYKEFLFTLICQIIKKLKENGTKSKRNCCDGKKKTMNKI